MDLLHFLVGIVGNATALFLFLAPMITFKRIIKKKTTEEFSCIPYVMTLLNCLLSGWYGLPFVSPNNTLVATINATGAVIEGIYIITFFLYAPKKEKANILGLVGVVIAIFSSVTLISIFALRGSTRKLFCGVAATVFSVIMYASPLSVMRLVIKTKSVEYMPFFLSLFAFLCGTSWLVYGLLGHDLFITIPNAFGCGLGAIQLILFFIYCGNKGEEDQKKDMKKSTMELGPTKSVSHEEKQMMANCNGLDAIEQV